MIPWSTWLSLISRLTSQRSKDPRLKFASIEASNLTLFRIDETAPKKRLLLSLRLENMSSKNPPPSLPLFHAFLRLPDYLASAAHFRPEVSRKIRAIREQEQSKLKKISDAEAEEERKLTAEKLKKEERERKMRGMTAEEQRKFLEKENQRSRKKSEKKMSRKG